MLVRDDNFFPLRIDIWRQEMQQKPNKSDSSYIQEEPVPFH